MTTTVKLDLAARLVEGSRCKLKNESALLVTPMPPTRIQIIWTYL